MPELTDLSMAQAREGLRRGDFSCLELSRACLERIDQVEPLLHVFITRTLELALAQAAAADRAYAAWRADPSIRLPALCGLPIAVKDVLCPAGVRCTSGAKILEQFIPPYSATSVQRLLDAGVVVLGKTNTDEYAMGSSTENSAYGPTRNPWDLSRVPGGSSGGSAASVAAQMALGALGTDTGGSVRQPASFCGVTGLKPTYGRVSRYGLVAYGSSLDSVGAFARTAQDVALLFTQMAGHDPRDATSLDLPVPPLGLPDHPDLRGLRIGVPREYFIAGIQPAITNIFHNGIGKKESILQHNPQLAAQISLVHTADIPPIMV